jgi:hypothetical protein
MLAQGGWTARYAHPIMKPLWLVLRIASVISGTLLVLISTFLYEPEEGLIQNKLEEWWVALSDAEPRALNKHTAFLAAVADFASRVFDQLFGKKLLSIRSVGVSACFSLASLGLVCSPGLKLFEMWYPAYVGALYGPVIIALIVIGILPAALGKRLSEPWWRVGVVLLCLAALAGMHSVDWFDAHARVVRETLYNAVFLLVTIGSDAIFIAATRWLLRRAAKFHNVARILGAILANISLAALLVFLPTFIAWKDLRNRVKLPDKLGITDAIVTYTWFSNSREIFLTTLSGSNVLDAIVACAFFILLLTLLLHRLLWPIVKRPIYVLASQGILRRRAFFLILGLLLMGAGGVSSSTLGLVKTILGALGRF